MGYGDDLLVTAFAEKIKKKYPERQIVVGNAKKKQAYHSIVYENNPNISNCNKLDPNKPIHVIDYHPGNRPYIDYNNSSSTNYVWNKNFKPSPGKIYFSKKEKLDAHEIVEKSKIFWKKHNKNDFKKIIFFETSSTKINDKQFSMKHRNKEWGYSNWVNLVNNLRKEYLIIQSVHNKTQNIEGVYKPNNMDFRLACAVMNLCDLYVGPEGGFGHVAAALKKKAVLYFGGWISPEIIGYNFHENIYFKDKLSPCGQYKNTCEHCEEARKKITVNIFETKIREYLLD